MNDWRFSAYALILVSLLLIIFSSLVHGDDLTGQPVDDPKDLMPAPSPSGAGSTMGSGLFVPMPAWARGVILPPLPVELKPMGGKTRIAGPPPTPPPLAPPKDVVTTTASSTPNTTPAKAAPADNNPAMIAVSPFLQWIKTNPQAATQARQQAEAYHAGAPAGGNPVNGGAPQSPGQGNAQDPYWLPPLIDSADFGPTPPVSGSAAIYSTPQR